MPYDPIQGQGQGHGGRKVAKMACSQKTNGEYLNFNWTIFLYSSSFGVTWPSDFRHLGIFRWSYLWNGWSYRLRV